MSAEVRFEVEGTITLALGETRTIKVIASPKGRSPIRFSLLGVPIDASLDRALVHPDDDGRAEVSLRAPTAAATFRLRASILDDEGQPGPTAETGVAVSDQGFGSVRVVPQYIGRRSIMGWTASVLAGATCAELSSSLPVRPDGALVVSTMTDEPLILQGAPVGIPLAVAVRSSEYAWGCTETIDLKPGDRLDVKVTVVDKPIDLASTALDLSFDFKPEAAEYKAFISSATELFADAFTPASTTEPAALLDAMAKLADTSAAFNVQRAAAGWDAETMQHLSALGPPLRERIAALAAAGLSLGEPKITTNLQATAEPHGAILTPYMFAGVSASAAGVPKESPLSWTAEPDDTLVLHGTLPFQPSRLLGAAALAAVKKEIPSAVEVPEALAVFADCKGLAVKLTGYSGCEVSCMQDLCHDALAARWASALDASMSAGRAGSLTLTAAGPAVLNARAEPVGLSGTWVGSLGDGVAKASVIGKFLGVAADSASVL